MFDRFCARGCVKAVAFVVYVLSFPRTRYQFFSEKESRLTSESRVFFIVPNEVEP